MSKFLLALALGAGCALARPAGAQVSKVTYAAGVGLMPVRGTAPDQANPYNYAGTTPGYVLKTVDADLLLLNVGLGFDAPLYQMSGGEQSLGVSLNVVGGLLYTAREDLDGFNGQTVLDFPEYVTYRYGAKASKHSKKDFGLGVGLGYRFSRFFLPFNAPSAMLEGVYASADHDYFLRLSADLRPRRFYSDFSSEGLVEVLRLRAFNVQVGRSF